VAAQLKVGNPAASEAVSVAVDTLELHLLVLPASVADSVHRPALVVFKEDSAEAFVVASIVAEVASGEEASGEETVVAMAEEGEVVSAIKAVEALADEVGMVVPMATEHLPTLPLDLGAVEVLAVGMAARPVAA